MIYYFYFLGLISIITYGIIESIDRVFIYDHFYFDHFFDQIMFMSYYFGIVGFLGVICGVVLSIMVVSIEMIKCFLFRLLSIINKHLSIKRYNYFYYRIVIMMIIILTFSYVNSSFRSQSSNQTLVPTIVKMIENSNSYVAFRSIALENNTVVQIKEIVENGNTNIKAGPILAFSIIIIISLITVILITVINRKYSFNNRLKEKFSFLLKERHFLMKFLYLAFVFLVLLLYYVDSRVYSNLYRIFHILIEIISIGLIFFVFHIYFSKTHEKSGHKIFTNKFILRFSVIFTAIILAVTPVLSLSIKSQKSIKSWIFRHTTFERQALIIIQSVFDFDGDGYSNLYDGGDSNNFNSDIHPLVEDVPNNSVNENELGKDLDTIIFSWEKRLPNKTLNNVTTSFDSNNFLSKNILLIHVDGLRVNRFGAFNHQYYRNLTPNLDSFSVYSSVFDHAFAAGSSTHASLHPMRAMSYSHNMNKIDMLDLDRISSQLGLTYHNFYDTLLASNGDNEITDKLIQYFDNNEPQSFMYWIYYGGPHYPNISHGYGFGNSIIDLYDEDVKYTDIQLSRLLKYLDSNNYLENTMVIIYGDHGEELFDHGSRFHGVSLYNELINVPLLIYVPDQKGNHFSLGVSLIDIFPTIFDYLGVDVELIEQRDGISLMPLIEKGDMEKKHKYIFSERDPESPNEFIEVSIINSVTQFKLIYNYKYYTFELYDLISDPLEKDNIIDSSPNERKDLENSLDFFLNHYRLNE
jgi:hypothetical protein